ncbi:MAG: nuclear transport factor 2 family protein [Acidobacteria bacterium]|nr:nuclear transport factor 2 family protein [Pyrinomonadaceae bacterium]MCC6451506.1 nuclear transport factor 2 family protein [Acidobacteriota bacterium]
MRKFYLGSVIIALSSLFFAACGGPAANTNTNANSGGQNTTSPNPNQQTQVAPANVPAGTTVKPVEETFNNAPTLAPVVHAYYDALKNKNTAALKEVLSAEFFARSEKQMKEDGAKDLATYMAEFDTIPDKPVEVRNEKIEGNKAVAQIKGGDYLGWTPFTFVNEGGKWKFTGGSADLNAVKDGK